MSDYVRPHRRQPTRLPRPWNSPGKNTRVGCHNSATSSHIGTCKRKRSELLILSFKKNNNDFICLFIIDCAGSTLLCGQCSRGKRDSSLVVMRGLLILLDSLAVEHRRWGFRASVVAACGLSSCGSRAPEHRLNSHGTQA